MEQFLAIILGAIISGLVGILTVYFTGKMREQEWKRENIYKPLYNEVSSLAITEGLILPSSLSTKWTTIDSYSKLLTDKELRNAFDSLVEECSKIRQSLEREEIYKEMQKKRKQIINYAINLKRELEKRINKPW